jgi:heme/copper-type cytochrome/quinol oxidase subunit 2
MSKKAKLFNKHFAKTLGIFILVLIFTVTFIFFLKDRKFTEKDRNVVENNN